MDSFSSLLCVTLCKYGEVEVQNSIRRKILKIKQKHMQANDKGFAVDGNLDEFAGPRFIFSSSRYLQPRVHDRYSRNLKARKFGKL